MRLHGSVLVIQATKLEVLRKDSAEDTFHRIKMITDPEEIQKGSYTDTDITITEYLLVYGACLFRTVSKTGKWMV